MNFYKKLVEISLPLARAKKIKKACIGISYVMVELEKGGAGLVSNFGDNLPTYLELGDEVHFWNAPADIIIKKYFSFHPIEISVALATINAVFSLLAFEDYSKKMVVEDPSLQIELSPEDEIVMIGYFEELFNKLKSKVKKIWILEKRDEILNFKIPQTDKIKLAIVSSSLLLTKSLEKLLKKIDSIPEIVLTGPETPLNPEIFKDTPVTWLLGVKVKDAEGLFRRVCEGKGMLSFLKAGVIEKVGMRIR